MEPKTYPQGTTLVFTYDHTISCEQLETAHKDAAKLPHTFIFIPRGIECSAPMLTDLAVRSALCETITRLGGDGAVCFMNEMTPAQLQDEIWHHVQWLEERVVETARAKLTPPSPCSDTR